MRAQNRPPSYEEAEIVIIDGIEYSTLITIKFNSPVIILPGTESMAYVYDIDDSYEQISTYFEQLKDRYGNFIFVKKYPGMPYGSSTDINIRTNESFEIDDVSQIFKIRFANLVPIDTLLSEIRSLEDVLWAQGPVVAYSLAEPDDPKFYELNTNPDFGTLDVGQFLQWGLRNVNAPPAWDLSKGRFVTIGILDFFDPPSELVYPGLALHPDLGYDPLIGGNRLDLSNVSNQDAGGHALNVSAIAGALTDNGVGAASLGWSVQLRGYDYSSAAIEKAACLYTFDTPDCEPVDVINLSLITRCDAPNPDESERIHDVLLKGIAVTAGSGNYPEGWGCLQDYPRVMYPAAYEFSDGLRVIAVTAGSADDTFPDETLDGRGGWNYSRCGSGTSILCNPLGDPANSFVDFNAPGFEGDYGAITYEPGDEYCPPNGDPCFYWCPPGGNPCHSYSLRWGTSFSTPMLSALAALIISINPTLTPDKIYEAIAATADKVGQYTYDVAGLNGYSWNRYFGYGQIDAYGALKYVIEHFGATVPAGETMTLTEDDFVLESGAQIIVSGELVITGSATLWSERDLVVNAGGELVAEAGATLLFAQGRKLDVYGSLEADGTIFSSTDVTDGWGGIRFRANSTGSITASSILNTKGSLGTAAVRSQNASPIISNVVIEVPAGSQAIGVYADGTSQGQGARIVDSVVESAAGPALYAGANGYISVYDSDITQSGGLPAVRADGANATVAFWPPPASPPYVGYDRISGGRLLARAGGVIEAGVGPNTKSQNEFCGAPAATLEANNSGTIYARYNYWPTTAGPTIITNGGTVYYSNNLGIADCGAGDLAAGGGNLRSTREDRHVGMTNAVSRGGEAGGESGSEEQMLLEAVRREDVGDYDASFVLLTDVAEGTGGTAGTALNELARLYAQDSTQAVATVLEDAAATSGSLQAAAQRALADVYAREGQTAEALSLLDTVASSTAGTTEAFVAQLAAFHILLNVGDLTGAAARLDAAEPITEDDTWALALAEALLAEVEGEAGTGGFEPPSAGATTDGVPIEYALGAAYPNPFAQRTTLPFELPEASRVEVGVYDLLGRRVAVLADGTFAEGRHEVMLEGRALASGVYVVRAVMVAGETVRTFTRRVTLMR